MGAKPRKHVLRRPVRDPDPYPLAHGDFVLAYAYAKRWLTLDGKRARSTLRRRRTVDETRRDIAKRAADEGLAELAKVRGVEKLPRRGSRKLRQQLRGAMETVWDRWSDPNHGDALGHKPPLKRRWDVYIRGLVRHAFYRTWDYYVPANGSVVLRIDPAHPILVAGATRTTTQAGYPQLGATYLIAITRDWYRDVYKRGLSVIDGRVVLAAAEHTPSDPDLHATADAVYRVTFVVKGHGYKLSLQDGIAARQGSVWTLVPYGTEGALQPKVADLHQAYRTAEQRLRKLAYRQYRKEKAS